MPGPVGVSLSFHVLLLLVRQTERLLPLPLETIPPLGYHHRGPRTLGSTSGRRLEPKRRYLHDCGQLWWEYPMRRDSHFRTGPHPPPEQIYLTGWVYLVVYQFPFSGPVNIGR